ncbi:MAG: PLP-dependent transferase [Candidatus Hodgkinia cicadicola]
MLNVRNDELVKLKKEIFKPISADTVLIKAFGAIHSGFVPSSGLGGSTVLFRNSTEMTNGSSEFTYGTHATPSTRDLCCALCELEAASATFLTASGLQALVLPFLALLTRGDHVLISDSIYEPLRKFCETVLPKLGVTVSFFNPKNLFTFKLLFRSYTKLVHLESPCSNTFEVLDVSAICKYVKARNPKCFVSMDNSWATPLVFKPLNHGVDLSINALTKHVSGTSEYIVGSLAVNKALIPNISLYHSLLGISVSDEQCIDLLKNLRTTRQRLKIHHEATLKVLNLLKHSPTVGKIYCPALSSFRGHKIWFRDYKSLNGQLSFELINNKQIFSASERCNRFLNRLQIFGLGWSWGGFKSLASPVDCGSRLYKPATSGPIIRLHIGFEDLNDLTWDLNMALNSAEY